MAIRDVMVSALESIMEERGINPLDQQNAEIFCPPDATFEYVVQHTETNLRNKPEDSLSDYKYLRYSDVLDSVFKHSSSRDNIAHLDIGCGAGLFAWAFLDKSEDVGIRIKNTVLYGDDHSENMIRLAWLMRDKIVKLGKIVEYPELFYYSNRETLKNEIINQETEGMEFLVTFGHSLEQMYHHGRQRAILDTADVVENIVIRIGDTGNCRLIAVDGRGRRTVRRHPIWRRVGRKNVIVDWDEEVTYEDDRLSRFQRAWDLLLSTLLDRGISFHDKQIEKTRLNDPQSAKYAVLR